MYAWIRAQFLSPLARSFSNGFLQAKIFIFLHTPIWRLGPADTALKGRTRMEDSFVQNFKPIGCFAAENSMTGQRK